MVDCYILLVINIKGLKSTNMYLLDVGCIKMSSGNLSFPDFFPLTTVFNSFFQIGRICFWGSHGTYGHNQLCYTTTSEIRSPYEETEFSIELCGLVKLLLFLLLPLCWSGSIQTPCGHNIVSLLKANIHFRTRNGARINLNKIKTLFYIHCFILFKIMSLWPNKPTTTAPNEVKVNK